MARLWDCQDHGVSGSTRRRAGWQGRVTDDRNTGGHEPSSIECSPDIVNDSAAPAGLKFAPVSTTCTRTRASCSPYSAATGGPVFLSVRVWGPICTHNRLAQRLRCRHGRAEAGKTDCGRREQPDLDPGTSRTGCGGHGRADRIRALEGAERSRYRCVVASPSKLPGELVSLPAAGSTRRRPPVAHPWCRRAGSRPGRRRPSSSTRLRRG